MYDIKLKQIECFLEVAQSLNLTNSAKKLFISQPLASKWIKSLEEELDVTLFEREKTGMVLTKQGEFLRDKWRPMFLELCSSIEEMHLLDQQLAGTLRVGCLDIFRYGPFLSELLNDFKGKNPNVKIEVASYGIKELADNLVSGRVDVAFHTTIDLKNNEDISWYPIRRVKFYIALSVHHPLAQKEFLKLEDLKDECFYSVSTQESPTSVSRIKKQCRKAGFEIKEFLTVPNIPSLALALIYQNGVTLTTEENISGYEDEIRLYETDEIKAQEYMALIWRTKNPGTIAKRFAECAANLVKQYEGREIPL